MVRIFELVAAGRLFWTASSLLRFEIERTPDPIRRLGALKLLSNASEIITPTSRSIQRAEELAATGLPSLDALHLALAEQSEVDWLITTDDRFRKQVWSRFEKKRPEVVDPVDWIQRRHPWLLPNLPSSAT
jgi:predicted nucleic acid-binding protein